MYLLITTCIVFLISNLCLATIHSDAKSIAIQNEQIQKCKILGDYCTENIDCCSELNCYSIEENKFCLPSILNTRSKHSVSDFIAPPYYNPNNQLYPYGISKPALPFYKAKDSKENSDRKNMEWNHCQFHEDCGEGNCCYVHFRFRSLPKWFCRPNRNNIDELCAPLTRYRSLKDVPAWKQQHNQR
ncbi:unnamed protein product [Rotaria magnacalcarata]|uniref:Uncharacterized protein n=1 Tax=Rotaria magnacalcarata TaxID=392030 RepID=A0A816S332_9BILA|nr:unnamed protein product [Rotaria magnacalcarata]CAF1679795.1 unnamed protein product [Rotaria magnacalcarata]CAF1938004.1 unnamed protein product [Rotaria magnacalcarata]CAF2046674.1 unnamed protein product [Rotaria magnacalcarata]CAF2083067.1 unnamed protein product [Rotaria magnacalcarata]